MTYQECLDKAWETLACMETISAQERENAVKEIWQEYLARFPTKPQETPWVIHGRHGISWSVTGAAGIGTFADGEPYVIGPCILTDISPGVSIQNEMNPISGVVQQRIANGSQINPSVHSPNCGYDSTATAFKTRFRPIYNPELNVGLRLPITLDPGMSVISTIGTSEATSRPQLRAASILTVLDARPPSEAFRLPYIAADDRKLRLVSELYAASPILGSIPEGLSEPETIDLLKGDIQAGGLRTGPWLEHIPDWPCREIRAKDNGPDFGRNSCALYGMGALKYLLRDEGATSMSLLMALVQIGLDYSAILSQDPDHWPAGGGHHSGRKFAILFAAWAMNDWTIAEPLKRPGAGLLDQHCPHINEDDQTFFVEETSSGVYNYGQGGFGTADVGKPAWGGQHYKQLRRGELPTKDGKAWPHEGGRDPYMTCCTANSWLAQVMVCRALGLEGRWDHPPFFAWVDHYVARISPLILSGAYESWQRSWHPWPWEVWQATNGGRSWTT